MVVNGDGPLDLFLADNITRDRAGISVAEYAVKPTKTKTAGVNALPAPPVWPAGFQAQPANTVKQRVLTNAGARPWDRDAVDQRIVRQVIEGQGQIIHSQDEVGGYPNAAMTERQLTVPADGIDAWLASFTPNPK